MTRIALLLLPLLSLGCWGNAFYVDARFTPAEAAELRAGAALWEPTGMHRDLIFGVRFSDADNDRNMVVRTNARGAELMDPWFREHASKSVCCHGAFQPTKIVIIMERLGSVPLRTVFAHELGHAMGLGHVTDPRAIMAPRWTEESLGCLTGADVVEACARGDACAAVEGCEVQR
jgi:hypothetical protein